MSKIILDLVTAKKVIKALNAEGIHFSVKGDSSGLKNIRVNSSFHTTFGSGVKVTIRVKQDDNERFDLICRAINSPVLDKEVPPRILWKDRRWFKRFFGAKS